MKWQGVHAADARHRTSCTPCSATAPGCYVVLVSVPRQTTSPYKLTTNSIARSKRSRAPSFVLLGSSQRCMLSPNKHDEMIINVPHRQHTTHSLQRGVPAASNTQRVHRTVRNRQAASRSIQSITCHNVQHLGYNVSPTPPGMPAIWHARHAQHAPQNMRILNMRHDA